ncbi:protein NLP4-like [Amaranthus tricolor]|uniref:protein NLP4-like n=1 Tax=Amaranthus tricolor TaxID=29722 RepID=UPI002585341D|nr:protein NLP4-like [Amaranthus tricolor]XP_057515616.1 protein NLP4-like [Amaranthus tricolor]XP_057515617.1 protein NLP4-like [Amaranthus tricolor]XP_057515618.1 protein NLP4-like [Amaranthus tricolor]XP_057515619.1 protein NLP4-like [Amaranthus tricolor]XP_057515620.1 protein NLP4-like [Amaranthus tricolor]
MNCVQNQKSIIDHSLSFEDVSKLFSLPLSEAAGILGVSTSALKKLCNENGLERWPHRKFLAGKTIDEIKKEAAIAKTKALGGTSPSRSNVATLTSGSRTKENSLKSTSGDHPVVATGLVSKTNPFSDEFKYGFPSSGLSECTYRWWESSFIGVDEVSNDDLNTSPEVQNTSKEQADEGFSCSREKNDSMIVDSGSEKSDEVLLSATRKRAVEEGKKGLKLRVLKKYGADKLGNDEKILLRLYQTS